MTIKTDNKTNKYLVFMDVEYYDVDNQTWENCSSDTFLAHIDVDADLMDKWLDDGNEIEDFFWERCLGRKRNEKQNWKWVKWISQMEWNYMTLEEKEIEISNPIEYFSNDELFADRPLVRIIDWNIDLK
tara:strand:+ start:713 stop:1099 length:387 start_codon:yes stop_codon:yes gene_type:complete